MKPKSLNVTGMNHQIGKYEFSKILFQNNFLTIYEGSRTSDNLALLFKTVESVFTVVDQIKTLKKEYKTVGEVDSPYIIKALEIISNESKAFLVMENIGGQSISNTLKIRDLTIGEFLDLAINLTIGIKDIHNQGMILKNLSLDSIIWNEKTKKCKIIDFSLASYRVLENAQLDIYLLKQTELGRIKRKKFEVTAKFFDKAVEVAMAYNLTHEEVIANERATNYCESVNLNYMSEFYLKKAFYAYVKWACLQKVDLLKEKYLFLSTNKPEEMQCTVAGNFFMSDSSPINHSNLDLNSILKTSYAN